jgi:hypothetical protein
MTDIEYVLTDIIIERPQDFKVGRKSFKLYPVTLAKMFLLKRQMDGLKLNTDILKANPYLEAIRLAKESRDVCCSILSYHTAPNNYKELFNTKAITIRKNFFSEKLSDEELASLMIYVLTADKTEEIIKHLGLDKERERIHKVIEVKKKHDQNNLSFNGLSLFGTFIGQLKEMGYSDNEILYEKGYTFLRLMLADKVTTVFITDEERQELGSDFVGDFVDANNPNNVEKIASMLSKKGIKISHDGR